MSRASRARQIAMGAAYGGGGATLLGASAIGLLLAQAKLARRAIGQPTSEPPHAPVVRRAQNGAPIRLAESRYSSAAGSECIARETPPSIRADGRYRQNVDVRTVRCRSRVPDLIAGPSVLHVTTYPAS